METGSSDLYRDLLHEARYALSYPVQDRGKGTPLDGETGSRTWVRDSPGELVLGLVQEGEDLPHARELPVTLRTARSFGPVICAGWSFLRAGGEAGIRESKHAAGLSETLRIGLVVPSGCALKYPSREVKEEPRRIVRHDESIPFRSVNPSDKDSLVLSVTIDRRAAPCSTKGQVRRYPSPALLFGTAYPSRPYSRAAYSSKLTSDPTYQMVK